MRTLRLLTILAGAALCAAAAEDFTQLPLLKSYTQERISSFDRTGANDDGAWANRIKPGETRILGEAAGPGIITHIWITIATPERYHLKKLVLRALLGRRCAARHRSAHRAISSASGWASTSSMNPARSRSARRRRSIAGFPCRSANRRRSP